MSDSGPPGSPFGDNDPFKGMPLFGDLAKLFQQQGPVNWEAARQLALSIAIGDTPESNTDPMDRIRIEQLARVADLQVANTTGLSTSITGRGVTVVPVTRSMAAQLALEAYRPLFEQLAGSLHQDGAMLEVDDLPSGADPVAWMGPLMQMIGPTMLGMTAGSMVGHLARRSFGQYDLPIPRVPDDELTIVPANIDEFGDQWSLPPDDLRLWVCLQTIATHAVLGVPHVRDRLERHLHDYLTGFETDSGSLERRLGDVDLGDPNGMAG
ncbi:MAG TPA: zinc-dependent metalloprotease, partial [Acidimicrobiales bacterium]|nr:zinc-dependent metalloprotease [Acidimicrobiales bacterium]